MSIERSLKIPRTIEDAVGKIDRKDDELAVKQGSAMANNKKFNKDKTIKAIEERDTDWEHVTQIPVTASEMMVVTVVKKLGAYIIAVTQKSPAKFRGVFVNRMQNFTLEVLQDLLQANFIRMQSMESKKKREDLQRQSIIKLKMLAYVAMVAEDAGCILLKQYKQISTMTGEAINLIAAWKKSDDERWKGK